MTRNKREREFIEQYGKLTPKELLEVIQQKWTSVELRVRSLGITNSHKVIQKFQSAMSLCEHYLRYQKPAVLADIKKEFPRGYEDILDVLAI